MSIEEENSIIVNEAQLFPRFPANKEGNKNPPKRDAKMVTNPSVRTNLKRKPNMVIVTQDRTSHETHFCVKIIATGNKGEVPQSVFIQLKEVKGKKEESSFLLR